MSIRKILGRTLVTGLLACCSVSAFAFSIKLDPRWTYLRNTFDPNYGYALDMPAFPLALVGLKPGDVIFMQEIGDFKAGNGNRPDTGLPFTDTSNSLLALFSSSATLLDRSLLNRVPGALMSDAPGVLSKPTSRGGLATDIGEDFDVFNGGFGVMVTIPAGANFLFFSASDTNFPDNTDPDNDYGVSITTVSVPEPSSLALILGGLSLLGLRRRFLRRD